MDRRAFLRRASAGLIPRRSEPPAGPPADTTSPLPRRRLGGTGVLVPILGLGTAPLGRELDDEAAAALISEAIDLGVTYIDTAPAVGGYGRAQLQVGAVMRQRRRQVFLVTKCFEPDGAAARRLLEQSLRELNTDRVELVHVHSIGKDRMDPEVVFGPTGAMRALLRARDEGLARYVGVSGHNRPARFLRALRDFPVDVIMTAANFVDVHTYDFEGIVWPAARRKAVGLVAMKVFGGPRPGQTTPARLPAAYHDLAFRYSLSLEACATAVIGVRSPAELRQNVERAHRFTPLKPAERDALRRDGARLAESWGPHLGSVE